MKKIKMIFMLLVILLIFPKNVFAGVAIGGSPIDTGNCNASLRWCYQNINGVRISLYTYKNGSLKYYGAKDYPAYGTLDNQRAFCVLDAAGKVAYQKAGKNLSWSSKTCTITMDGSTNFGDNAYASGVASKIKSAVESTFDLKTKDEKKIIKAMNSFFGLKNNINTADVYYTYITVEPTFLVVKRGSGQYFGTAYELLYLPGFSKTTSPTTGTVIKNSYHGIDGLVFHDFLESIVATNPTSPDKNNFVTSDKNALVRTFTDTKGKKVSGISLEYSYNQVLASEKGRLSNKGKATGNNGYGIGVFWPGDYIDFTCKKTCNGKSGDSLLSCAENYCSTTSNSSATKKKNCITSCGYQQPASFSCNVSNTSKQTTSTCKAKATGTKKTCSISGYFKTSCTETTTVNYPDLPNKNSLYAGVATNFNYSITTSGTKTCTKEFNHSLFKFDYATKVNSTQRNDMKAILNNTYFKNKDIDSFAYSTKESEWNSKTLKNPSSSYTLGWKSNSLKNSLDNSKTKTTNIKLYANGKTSTESSKYYKKVYVSTNSGSITKTNIPYIVSSNGKKNTNVSIKRNSSNLNDVNTCSYTIRKSNEPIENLSCVGTIKSTPVGGYYTGNVEVEYRVTYTTKTNASAAAVIGNNNNLKYYFNGNTRNKYNVNSNFKIATTIPKASGETIKNTLNIESLSGATASCEVVIPFKTKEVCTINMTKSNDNKNIVVSTNGGSLSCKSGDETISMNKSGSNYYQSIENLLKGLANPYKEVECTTIVDGATCSDSISVGSCSYLSPAQKDKINTYCENYWNLDADNYSNVTDCISKCSSNACPTNADEATTIAWCNEKYSQLGYVDQYACLNNCKSSKYGEKYIFRPITLGKKENLSEPYNAFPNRKAGANWYLIEEKTTTNSFTETPIYVITLNRDSIQQIRDSNAKLDKGDAYMPYEQLTSSEKKNEFRSNFIRKEIEKYICIGGGC